jgi:hypothetical protein
MRELDIPESLDRTKGKTRAQIDAIRDAAIQNAARGQRPPARFTPKINELPTRAPAKVSKSVLANGSVDFADKA